MPAFRSYAAQCDPLLVTVKPALHLLQTKFDMRLLAELYMQIPPDAQRSGLV